jgi:hypothetical protein
MTLPIIVELAIGFFIIIFIYKLTLGKDLKRIIELFEQHKGTPDKSETEEEVKRQQK